MKKLFALLMIVSLMLLVGCSGITEEKTNEEASEVTDGDETRTEDVDDQEDGDVEDEDGDESKGEEDDKAEVEVPKVEPPAVEPPAVEPPAVEATVFQVAGNEFSFGPSNFSAKVGQPVKFVFKNNGKAVHDLQVVGLGKTALIDPGQTGTVEFTPTAAGTYEIICTVPGHKELGMAGTLTVQ